MIMKPELSIRCHALKIEEHFARQIHKGMKTCEVRKNDRDFQKGDVIFFTINSFEDGEWELFQHEITHVLHGGQYGIEDGYVVLSIRPKMFTS